jgi:hypothetical protein
LHLRLVRFCVSDELPQIVRRQILARDQYVWGLGDQELSLVMLKFTKRSLQVEMLGGLCGLGNPIT